MSYSSNGPKPFERASKASHHHIINDEVVKSTLEKLWIPPTQDGQSLLERIHIFQPAKSKITNVIAIDGGYTEIPVRVNYPSATLHFFQFGALLLSLSDLRKVSMSRHPDPDDMSRLKNIQRLKLAIPTRNVRFQAQHSLKESIRTALYEFFCRETLGERSSLMETLAWFIFRRYKGSTRDTFDTQWNLSSNPYDGENDEKYESVSLQEEVMSPDFTFVCPNTKKPIFLTDAFRLHERIEEGSGAAGICGYVTGVVEHIVAIHIVRHLLRVSSSKLAEVLFIMDRPTGFFGQTARLHEPMLDLVTWVQTHHHLFWAGLEKSGAFVEHASRISRLMEPGTFLILDDEYIYTYISPGNPDPVRPYASTSYYGHKVIFKTRTGNMYVVSVPVKYLKKSPSREDLPNLDIILTHVEDLKCDMYENSLFPVALANKLVSLSAFPSTQILTQFAKSAIGERT